MDRTLACARNQEHRVYAVIATGGKQLRVEQGQEVRVELLEGAVGDTVALRPVLVVGDNGDVVAGEALAGRQVSATITSHEKDPRVRVFTYKNKSRQRKRRGHRQNRTMLRIESI
jgi:large subunit ribosomal protein L21